MHGGAASSLVPGAGTMERGGCGQGQGHWVQGAVGSRNTSSCAHSWMAERLAAAEGGSPPGLCRVFGGCLGSMGSADRGALGGRGFLSGSLKGASRGATGQEVSARRAERDKAAWQSCW